MCVYGLLALLAAAVGLAQSVPTTAAIAAAAHACSSIFAVIERTSDIDALGTTGKVPVRRPRLCGTRTHTPT
jgi:hypothetical protein